MWDHTVLPSLSTANWNCLTVPRTGFRLPTTTTTNLFSEMYEYR